MDRKDKTSGFMSLLVQNQKWIQAYISYMVPNRSDCEDILQDTLTEMWNKFDEYKEGTNFKAWGISIARFKVLSHQAKYQKFKFHFHSDTIKLLEKESHVELDEKHLENQKDILKGCLKKLSSKEREYLGFRYEQQLTFEGIADRFGVSMQAAFKAISIIHARLLKCVHLGMESEGLL
jgi:RNA polymerase sigma-70 factor (ECF subfamily)